MNERYKLTGLIRAEKFGGLYYERDRLVIELLNNSSFEIMDLIGKGYSVKETIERITKKYDVDYSRVEEDVLKYVSYLEKSGYIVSESSSDNSNASVYLQKSKEHTLVWQDFILGMEPYELRAPLKVLLELTYACNLRCIHCFADADYCKEGKTIEKELGYEEWCRIIDNIVKNDVFEILLSGGEATMRDDLIKICEYIHSKNRTYSLLSNATLIDSKMARELKRTGCSKVESNLDGYDAKSYEAFRGVKGSFEKTIKGIKACLEAGIPVRCNVMETKKTIFNLKEIVDVAYKIGVREVCVIPLELGGRAKNLKEICFQKGDLEDLNSFYEDVNQWFDKKYGNTDMVLFTPNQFSKNKESKYTKVFDIAGMMPRCGAGLIHCTINPYGIVKMCPTDHSLLVNEQLNILHDDLGNIWKNSKVLKTIRGNNFRKCVHCDQTCEMECPVMRNELEGTLNYSCHMGE